MYLAVSENRWKTVSYSLEVISRSSPNGWRWGGNGW